jgi:hypothetical protein
MFRFNQKKANRELDELKKLLSITKGMKTTNKSVSASFLKEEVDITGNPIQTPPSDNMGDAQLQGGADLAKTDDTKEIEKAILNSTITSVGPEGDEQVVKGYVSSSDEEKGLYFKFSSKQNNPVIQTKKAITLDDDLMKSIEQIASYFESWKSTVEK